MGKRVVGQLLPRSRRATTALHACIYLFTVDMEMEPLPGFKLTSWERGYGDMKMVPDLATLRLIPWLPKTALVFCDVYTEDGEPIEEAPRWILKRQIERAARRATSSRPRPSSSSTASGVVRGGARKRHHELTPVSGYLEDYHILQTSKEEPLIRAIRNGMEAADVPVETLEGRVGARPGRDQPPLRRGARDGGPGRALQARREGDRVPARLAPSRSWPSTTWPRPARRSTCTPRSGTRRAASPCSPPAVGIRTASPPLFGQWLAGQLAHGARARLLLRARRELLQALSVRIVRAHAHRGRVGQPDVRLPALRRRRRLPRREPHPRRRRQSRISPSPPRSPPGSTASRAS